MRKSLTLRMFPPKMDTLSRLELARAAGFAGVEVNLEPWQEYSLASSDDELRAEPRHRRVRPVRQHSLQSRAMVLADEQP
jgi:hypothetical protein